MKKGMIKRGLAATLTVAMCVGLCGCGGSGNNGGKNAGKQRYFKTTYLEDVPDTFTSDLQGNPFFKGDTFYYGVSDETYTNSSLYALNLLTNEQKLIWQSDNDPDSESKESVSVNSSAVDDEGNVYLYLNHSQIDEASLTEDYSSKTLDDVIAYMTDSWGYDEDMARSDWNEYYASEYVDEDGNPDYGRFLKEVAAEWVYDYQLEKLDKDGNVVYNVAMEQPNSENGGSSCYAMAADADGNLCVLMNVWTDTTDDYYVLIFDGSGTQTGRIDLTGYASDMMTLPEGTVAVSGYGDTGAELYVLDLKNQKIAETRKYDDMGTMIPLDETHMLYSDGLTVWSYNSEDGTREKYFNWMDCNIASSSVTSFGVLSDGTIGVFTQNWNSDGSQCDLAIIKEVDESEVGNVTEINVACMWLDSSIEEKAIAFNKKHEDYHINITQYYDNELEYEDAVNAYTTAIASDNTIDIIIFNDYSEVVNFAAKGLLIDIYELIDSDAEMKREDFLPNILQACEQDGKLVTLPSMFSLQTVVGKTEDVGTEPGWTFDEMKALLDSKEPGTELFYGMTREQALNMCLNLGYQDFINWDDSSCNFNSPEFADVLEFAAMFPEEFDYDENEDETVLINTGKVLLSTYYLGQFEEVQMYRTIFGGDVTYIGYPTSEGNGAMLNLQNMYGITKYCEDKEVAWEFLRQFYLPAEDGTYESSSGYGFSVRQDAFDKACEEAMKEDEYGGSSWGWGQFEVEIQPATQEDVDAVRNLVENTTAVSGAVSNDILNIIKEEAAAYFAGQKTAEDVAAIIQSRMEIYLKETK